MSCPEKLCEWLVECFVEFILTSFIGDFVRQPIFRELSRAYSAFCGIWCEVRENSLTFLKAAVAK